LCKLHSEIAFKIKVMRKSWELVCDWERVRGARWASHDATS